MALIPGRRWNLPLRLRIYFVAMAIIVPLWVRGIWKEHLTETRGRDVIGRVVGGDFKNRRPGIDVDYSTRSGTHQKRFSVSSDEVRAFTQGTDQILNPEIKLFVHDDYPDDARILSHPPLPWWAGVLGMIVTLTVGSVVLLIPRRVPKA